MRLKAAAYIRVSTADQTEFSPDAQLKQIKEYAKNNEIDLLEEHIYADEGISGRTTVKRIAFNHMIKNAKKNPRPFDLILIHKFNRFARNREDAIIFKSLLKRDCGIKVISITEPIDDGKIGIIIESMLDAFAEYYSLNLADEVKKGMSEKASRGGVQTRAPLGYDIINNQYVVNDEEAKVVKIIFEKFLEENLTYIDVANYLNRLGIRTKRSNKFQSKAIKYILTNPTYKGYLRWNRKNKNGSLKNTSEWIIAQGNFTPIISEKMYEAAQKKVKYLSSIKPKYARPKYEYKHYLSGLLVCSHCGGKMVFTNQRGYTYFRCRKSKDGACSIKSGIKTKILEEAIIDQIDKDFHSIQLKLEKDNKVTDYNELDLYYRQLNNLEKKLSKAKHAYLNGVDTLEEYQNNKINIKQEREFVHRSINKLKQEMQKQDETPILEIKKISDVLNQLETISKKNAVLKLFVKNIQIDIQNQEFVIQYCY